MHTRFLKFNLTPKPTSNNLHAWRSFSSMVSFGHRNGESRECHKGSLYLIVVLEDAISFPNGIIFRNVIRFFWFHFVTFYEFTNILCNCSGCWIAISYCSLKLYLVIFQMFLLFCVFVIVYANVLITAFCRGSTLARNWRG